MEGRIPATLGNPEPILSKVDVVKFANPSSFDIWILWVLVIICTMPRGLYHSCKVNGNLKQTDESLIGQYEHNTFKTLRNKLQNLLEKKLQTDVTLLFLSVADNNIFVSQVWTMKLTESTNICYISVRDFCNFCDLKWIPKKPWWETIFFWKCLFGECTAVRE